MVINKELDSTNLPPLLTDLSRQGPQYLPSLINTKRKLVPNWIIYDISFGRLVSDCCNLLFNLQATIFYTTRKLVKALVSFSILHKKVTVCRSVSDHLSQEVWSRHYFLQYLSHGLTWMDCNMSWHIYFSQNNLSGY